MEEQQLDDHYLCTDIDRMENIARQVPLSAMERPAWDTKVLEFLGVCSIQTDSEIWKRVWSEEERLNYASTPMFLVRAEKSAEQPFQLGDVTVRRGEKYQAASEDGLWYPAAKTGRYGNRRWPCRCLRKNCARAGVRQRIRCAYI